MKYGIFRKDEKVVAKAFIVNEDKLPVIDGAELTLCTEQEYNDAVIVCAVQYDSDTLISWAMQQLFTVDLIPHFAAFLDFANKASDASAANFRAYAQSVGMSEMAETIISKAIELGANITVGE